jgi:hypothetical protein
MVAHAFLEPRKTKEKFVGASIPIGVSGVNDNYPRPGNTEGCLYKRDAMPNPSYGCGHACAFVIQ